MKLLHSGVTILTCTRTLVCMSRSLFLELLRYAVSVELQLDAILQYTIVVHLSHVINFFQQVKQALALIGTLIAEGYWHRWCEFDAVRCRLQTLLLEGIHRCVDVLRQGGATEVPFISGLHVFHLCF